MAAPKIGEQFPDISVAIVGNGTRRLPADLRHANTVLLFYRGHW